MFRREPKERIETAEMPVVGREEGFPNGSPPDKSWQAGRNLMLFKSLVLTAIMVITLYGMLNRGLFELERWLPVAAAILGIFFITLFVVEYFADVPRIVWVLAGLLAVLVAVKGLSLIWSISPPETIKELLRSSMYLAAFVLAAASFSSRRLAGPFIDGMNIIVGAVAGYGVLQKTDPTDYPSTTASGVRIGSTLEYANTVAVVLGMGIVLGLGRMTGLRNPVARGLYAALILVLSVVLYFTFSRGGMLALGVGLLLLFVVGERRLQMFANLLLVSLPLGWLLWRAQDLTTFFSYTSDEDLRAAEGTTFLIYLVVAVIVAFLLQAGYAILLERYELSSWVRRALTAAAVVTALASIGFLGYQAVNQQLVESGGPFSTFAQGLEEPKQANERLTSLSSNSRSIYWRVAWEEWLKHPLTGTGAGTFQYTWLENRPHTSGVKQVHNVYLEQGTETGILAFLALMGFAALLVVYAARATWRAAGERRVLLAGLTGAVAVYLVSSALEWHWYVLPSTIFFFILAGVAAKFASREEQEV
ncbi:MAG TPA: O-antigen ligase family protein [Rubrobacteraceae bacterium]|nr:O-antigen ligase family protein [Rubrobacteraceae bacterium]